jgi:hypothetical protein
MARNPYEQPQERRVANTGRARSSGYQTQGGAAEVTQRKFSRKEMKTADRLARAATTPSPSSPTRVAVGRGQRPDIAPVFRGAHEMVAKHLGIEENTPRAVAQKVSAMRRGTA